MLTKWNRTSIEDDLLKAIDWPVMAGKALLMWPEALQMAIVMQIDYPTHLEPGEFYRTVIAPKLGLPPESAVAVAALVNAAREFLSETETAPLEEAATEAPTFGDPD